MSGLRVEWAADRAAATLYGPRGRVGWVVRGAVGFGGHATAHDAVHAALVGYTAALEGLRRVGVDIGHGAPGRALATTREGGRDWIRVGGRIIGWLLPPDARLRTGPDAYGFELLIPTHVPMRAAVELALRMHAKLHAPPRRGAWLACVRERPAPVDVVETASASLSASPAAG